MPAPRLLPRTCYAVPIPRSTGPPSPQIRRRQFPCHSRESACALLEIPYLRICTARRCVPLFPPGAWLRRIPCTRLHRRDQRHRLQLSPLPRWSEPCILIPPPVCAPRRFLPCC